MKADTSYAILKPFSSETPQKTQSEGGQRFGIKWPTYLGAAAWPDDKGYDFPRGISAVKKP